MYLPHHVRLHTCHYLWYLRGHRPMVHLQDLALRLLRLKLLNWHRRLDLNVWWQIPNVVLGVLSECFCNVMVRELAYVRSPKNMRALVMSLFLLNNALSAAFGEAVIPAIQDPYIFGC
jgi:dipeptide/tripeptide permease